MEPTKDRFHEIKVSSRSIATDWLARRIKLNEINKSYIFVL